ELCRIGPRQIRAQQIAAFSAARLTQSLPVQTKAERFRRDRLVLVGQLEVDDPVSRWCGLFPGGSQLDEQLITGQLLLAQLLQTLHQLLGVPPAALRFYTVAYCTPSCPLTAQRPVGWRSGF